VWIRVTALLLDRSDPRVARSRRDVGARAALVLPAVALTAVMAAFVYTEAERDRAAFAVVYGLIVAAPLGVGLAAWNSVPDSRFVRLLMATGALFSVTALSVSPEPTLYSVGRVAAWLVEPALFLLILSFPSGRLPRTRDRQLLAALFALVALLYLPTALMLERFPEPSPWSWCGVDCPNNALQLFPGAVAFADDVLRPVREVLAVLLLAGVLASLIARYRRAQPLRRRVLAPVVAIALLQVLAFAVYQWQRRGGTVTDAVVWAGWIFMLLLPAVALSFAAGLVNRRLHAAPALQRLTLRLRAPATAAELRTGLAEVLEDPSLRVAYRAPGDADGWIDETGASVAAPQPANGRGCTEIHADGRPLAVISYDAALAPDATLIEAAAAYGLVVLDNTRLFDALKTSLRKVSELETTSRTAAAGERKRIERDLHDGAQQRLLALRIRLGLLAEQLVRDAPGSAAELERLGDQAEATIQDVRALAHGLAPALLTDAGIGVALQAAVVHAPLGTTVRADGIARYSGEVEGAVYFSCVEALQNAVKHAHGATRVDIDVTADGRLRFEVRDDGGGFPGEPGDGSGLRNMRDRLAAVGGWLQVDSTPNRGTSVVGTIPLP
jgi:signal transduction histidine kinase